MQFGEKLRSLRASINMTQKELADKLSISPSTIGMYEQNRRMPDTETLLKMASIFGVSVDYLLSKESSLGQYVQAQRARCDIEEIEYLIPDYHELSELELKWLKSFRQLTEENQYIIIGDMQKYIKEQRHESVAADVPPGKTGTDSPK